MARIGKGTNGHFMCAEIFLMYEFCVDDSGAISPTMEELFPSATDVLETLCGAVLEGCPRQLNPHLPTIVATLIPYARHIKTTYGKKVRCYATY